MAEEKTDFEKGLEAKERELRGGVLNENEDKALRDLDDRTIFERVHERYVDEDRKGHFIKDE